MTPDEKTNDNTVHLERVFDFPPEMVFDAWTKPEVLGRWFAPHGCSIRFERLDARAGGGFLACVSNPAFGDCWTAAVYREVTRPSRIAFDWFITDEHGARVDPSTQGHDPEWPAQTVVELDFQDLGGRTLLTLRQNVRTSLAERTGALPSWIQMIERLDSVLAGRDTED